MKIRASVRNGHLVDNFNCYYYGVTCGHTVYTDRAIKQDAELPCTTATHKDKTAALNDHIKLIAR